MSSWDRSQAPQPGPPFLFRFPPFAHRQLLPGVDLYTARVQRAPLVSIELVCPGGGQHDVEGRRGLASLTADVLDEGTERRSGPELAALLERLGGSCSTTADWDATYVASTVLAEHAKQALAVVAEVALQPTLPEREVERLRRRRLTELARRRTSPSALAEERFSAVLYGAGPYGQPLIGTEDEIVSLDRATCVDFYRSTIRRGGATLIMSGDVDMDAMAAMAAELFADWPSEPAPAPREVAPRRPEAIEVHVVDRPEGKQTELRLGHPGPPRNHPDRIALSVLNSMLGGKFISRINLNLRERHGYTYGAHTSFASRRGPGPFQMSTAVANDVAGAALEEVFVELRRLRDEIVPAAELDDAVNYLQGVFPYTLQTVESVAQRLSQLAVYGLPDDYFDRYQQELRLVSPELLLELARRHIEPDHSAVVAVGPADSLVPQLERFGPVTVWPTASSTAAPGEG